MTPNDILRRLRYTFNFNDDAMKAVFALAGLEASREQISDWLKQDENPAFKAMNDEQLAHFLQGLIIEKRGKKEGAAPVLETVLNNNLVFRKLRIALDFKEEDVLAVMAKAGFPIGKHELSALFRRPDHKNYRECQDQILRNFLNGLQKQFREAKTKELP